MLHTLKSIADGLYIQIMSLLAMVLPARATAKIHSAARGAGFFEYALLIVLAVVIFLFLRGPITDALGSIITKFKGEAGTSY